MASGKVNLDERFGVDAKLVKHLKANLIRRLESRWGEKPFHPIAEAEVAAETEGLVHPRAAEIRTFLTISMVGVNGVKTLGRPKSAPATATAYGDAASEARLDAILARWSAEERELHR